MAYDTQSLAPLPKPTQPQEEELQSCLLTICPPPQDRSVLKRRRGRPVELTLPHLALGMLLCLVHGWESQLDLWRRLCFEGVGAWPLLDICDQTVYTRLGQHGMQAMQDCFTQVSLWVAQLAPLGAPRTLAPFAREVLALDESTLDRLKRWLPPLRGLPTGHDGLLPGRLAGLFDVRTQLWRRLDILPQARANCKVHARDMLEGLQAGTLLLFDRGYFAFEWFDELTTAGLFWISRQIASPSFPVEHILLSQDGLFDAIVWMGASSSNQARYAVRLIRYRYLDQKLDLSFVRGFVQQRYAQQGRPSIDPVVFFKLQLVMFFEGIRSERQLIRQAADRLSVRWYLGYDLSEPLPDHSSLSCIRTRYGLDVFRRFFDAIVEQCQQAKLVWGKELYFDGTQVNANADLDSLTPRFAVEAREAMQSHLAALFPEGDNEPEHEITVAPAADASMSASAAETDACQEPRSLPVTLSQTQQEELSAENARRHDWIAEEGRPQREVRSDYQYYQRAADFRISTTDPDATPMRLKSGGLHLGYHPQDARGWRETSHHPGGPGDACRGHGQPADARPALACALSLASATSARVTGDTKYGTLENIKAIEDAGIRAYVPLPDWEHRTSYYGPSKFIYDAAQDRYFCPQGQPLRPFRRELKAEKVEYRADAATCNMCPLKAQCTPSDSGRQVHHSFHASYLERVKGYHQTPAYQKAMNKRKVWVEPLFAEAKDWHGMRRFRLRRLWRVNCGAQVIAAGQNLKRLLQKRGWGRRPFPAEAISASFWLLLPSCLPFFRRASHERVLAIILENVFFKAGVCPFADLLSFSNRLLRFLRQIDELHKEGLFKELGARQKLTGTPIERVSIRCYQQVCLTVHPRSHVRGVLPILPIVAQID